MNASAMAVLYSLATFPNTVSNSCCCRVVDRTCMSTDSVPLKSRHAEAIKPVGTQHSYSHHALAPHGAQSRSI